MHKLIYTISFIFVGSLAFGSDSDMDIYYGSIDEECPVLSAHHKNTNNAKDVMRKRAYKRKRVRRLPNKGK
tara:strand:+ start:421 stop:633 length:213 start_codon:yes stop_codon:yes gene_type:complete